MVELGKRAAEVLKTPRHLACLCGLRGRCYQFLARRRPPGRSWLRQRGALVAAPAALHPGAVALLRQEAAAVYSAAERVSPPSELGLIGKGTPGSHSSIISITVSLGVP
jgi:hypothetical protein